MKNKSTKTVQTYRVGTFEIRLSEAKAEIESKKKEWKYIVASGTRPFAELVSAIARDKQDSIHVLCNALYSSTLFFYYPEFCVDFVCRCDEYVRKLKKR